METLWEKLARRFVGLFMYIPFVVWSVCDEQIFSEYPLTMWQSVERAHLMWEFSFWD